MQRELLRLLKNMHISEIENKKVWEEFLNDPKIVYYPLFQSWNWGAVQKRLGHRVWRVGVWQKKDLVAVCQIIEVKARRGHYFHLRHGPVLKPFNPGVLDSLLDFVKNLAKKEGAAFVRLSPLVEKSLVPEDSLKKRNMISAPVHNMDAEICWVLDITKAPEELLKNMRKSHRYLIRQGFKIQDLRIKKTRDANDVEKFIPLYKHLSQRKHFVPHRGVVEEFDVFSKEDAETLFLSFYKKKIISGALVAFVGSVAIYRHSASDDEYRFLPSMYLLLWEAILEAQKRGMKLFNFWGIAPRDNPKHPWAGLSLFKTGFGGEKKEFLHAQDIPLSRLYWKTYLIERVSTMLKGY